MYEIEAKVPIKKTNLPKLRKAIQSFAKYKGKSVRKDSYYGTSKDYLTIRLRDENGGAFLNIKTKRNILGMEHNEEISFSVTSKTEFHKLFHRIGVKRYATKKKTH